MFSVKRSIFYKFMTVVLIILVLNTIALSIIYLSYGKRYSYQLYHDKVRILLSFLRFTAAYGLFVGDEDNLRFVSQILLNDPDIVHLAIIDKDKEIFLRTGIDISEKLYPDFSHPDVPDVIMRSYHKGQKEILLACSRVYGPSLSGKEEHLLTEEGPQEYLGMVCIALDLSNLLEVFYEIRTRVILVSIVITFIAILATYFLGRIISQPLKDLAEAAQVFSQGKLPPPVQIRSEDEVGELAQAFNAMVEEISRSQEELRQYASRLEDLVQKRTKALKRSLEQLRRAYEELQKIHDLKARFLQKASHELRTPLTVIKANLDYIFSYESDRLKPDFVDLLEPIERNVTYMHRLVEDMLTIVRFQDGRLKLHKKPVCLKKLILDCLNQLRPLIGQRDIIVDIPDNLELFLDYDRFRDVIVNLLSNAIRFTEDGDKIRFWVEEDEKEIRLYVSDTGEGISPEHLPHLFEPFYQASAKKGGTGLGLAIVKAIVEEHGGRVEVESVPGKGTTFIITLPKERSHA